MFHEDRIEVMHKMMAEHPFATVVSAATGGLSADHIPLVLRGGPTKKGCLRGHIAAANPLWRDTESEIQILAVFQGPQSYVTPFWYPLKQTDGKVVPTWNYVVVHAHGTLRFKRESQWLMDHLAELTRRRESRRAAPWVISGAPDAFIASQLKGLVGFEVEIKSLLGSWKLCRNKKAADRQGVALGLVSKDNNEAAAVSRLVQDRSKD
tara:strand:+ start:564 stop:1187 length:624 start_codon:yes stop_codon:yes gene_type:complete